jgi:hypothetical protein
MERAGKTIAKLKSAANISPEELARAVWPEAVGKRIAGHAIAVSLVRGRLVVEVEDAIWRKQLYLLRYQIVERIAQVLGEGVVNEVEFRVGVRKRPPQVAERASGAEDIADPVFRLLYQQGKKRATS